MTCNQLFFLSFKLFLQIANLFIALGIVVLGFLKLFSQCLIGCFGFTVGFLDFRLKRFNFATHRIHFRFSFFNLLSMACDQLLFFRFKLFSEVANFIAELAFAAFSFFKLAAQRLGIAFGCFDIRPKRFKFAPHRANFRFRIIKLFFIVGSDLVFL